MDGSSANPLDRASRELEAGERLIWAEHPGLPIHTWVKQLPPALFGTVFLGFALFWTIGAARTAWQSGAPWFFPLFGLPFVAVGLGMLAKPLTPYIGFLRRQTVYAITDRRLFILQQFPRYRLESFFPRDIGPLTVETRADGSGDLVFQDRVETRRGEPEPVDLVGDREPPPREQTRRITRAFRGIPEVREVARAVEKLRDGPRTLH